MKYLKQLFLLGAFLLPILSQAQEVRRVRLNVGLKGGLNLSKLDGENWEGGYKSNILGGAFVRVHNGRVGVSVEGFFSQVSYTTGKDFKSIYNSYVDSAKSTLESGRLQVSYFNIPVILQIKVVSRVWLQVGPQFSGVVSVKDKDAFFKDAESIIKKGTLSGVGGIWVDLPFHLNAGARYVLAFSRFDDNDVDASWKQRNVQVHVGLTF